MIRHLHAPRLLLAALATLSAPLCLAGQSGLPATAPTAAGAGLTAPIAAVSTPADRFGAKPQRAEVSCPDGQIEVRADNSSLNGILRAIARCTGMRITGGVTEQRVFGNYGPAAPATVLATLIDGTGSNMLLRERTADQPAELILTPRTGGPTPPAPSTYEDADAAPQPSAQPLTQGQPYMHPDQTLPRGLANRLQQSQGAQPVTPPGTNSAVTGPQQIPQPLNNVNGSPRNTSPTASTYPTTNSVPLDSIRTPSTTPSTDGIVDAPNPPPAGSDTAAVLNGAPRGTPGTTNIDPGATSATSTPGATNTTVPVNTPQQSDPSSDLTPEQIFQKLQQRQQQQQQRQQEQQQQPQDTTPQ